jgi:hypothetical protein
VSNGNNRVVVGSPGVGGTSNSSSSSASWRSGTPSPPLSDEGALSSNGLWLSNGTTGAPHPAHNQRYYQYHHAQGSSSSSPNFTTYDEGIVPDLDLERPRKKKVSQCILASSWACVISHPRAAREPPESRPRAAGVLPNSHEVGISSDVQLSRTASPPYAMAH